ncbi:PAS domain S-box protein [Ureibacillus sp. GCM10028918]|uniref:sensor domain-containing diguanylate cyclase n=1 Tax=Ureibacillus sp. GCM10028918 TaxID=3273429 RepID=UPI0036190D2B
MFQTVANKLGLGLFMVQNDQFLWVNKSFGEIFHDELEEILLKSPIELVYPEDVHEINEFIPQFQAGEIEQCEVELRGVKKDGTIFNMSLSIKLIQFEDKPTIIGSVMDISQRKKMEMELKESKNRYKNLVENAPIGIIVHQKGIIQYANPIASKLLGASTPIELIGQPIKRFIHRQYEEIVSKRIHKVQNLGVAATPLYQRLVRLDGTAIDVETSAIPIQLNGAHAIESIFWDVTEKKKEEELIRYRAYFDTLTDLPNFHKFQLDFEEEFHRDQKLTILYIKLNGLKEIYDSYGKQAGDLVLIKVGGRLSGVMANRGLVYRMDGYRFSVVLSGEVKENELHAMVERINRTVSQPIYITNTTVEVSVQIGVVVYPQDGGEINLILHHADLAINHAKITNSLYKKYDG